MKIWIDTEFNGHGGELISMALVAENGKEWYGVRDHDYPIDPWVREHVIPFLGQDPDADSTLHESLNQYLHGFDSVHIIADWPADIAHFCRFLECKPGCRIGPLNMTFEINSDLPDTAAFSAIPHNALEDARALAHVQCPK